MFYIYKKNSIFVQDWIFNVENGTFWPKERKFQGNKKNLKFSWDPKRVNNWIKRDRDLKRQSSIRIRSAMTWEEGSGSEKNSVGSAAPLVGSVSCFQYFVLEKEPPLIWGFHQCSRSKRFFSDLKPVVRPVRIWIWVKFYVRKRLIKQQQIFNIVFHWGWRIVVMFF